MLAEIESLVAQLEAFNGGIADASTLIYLERLGMLPLAARCFTLSIIPQVATEYGEIPEGTVALPELAAGPADAALCQAAQILGQPVLSEDRKVLKSAKALQLRHYNTLLLILALCAQGKLALSAYGEIRRNLLAFAHYSAQVFAVGDAVFDSLLRSRGGNGTGQESF